MMYTGVPAVTAAAVVNTDEKPRGSLPPSSSQPSSGAPSQSWSMLSHVSSTALLAVEQTTPLVPLQTTVPPEQSLWDGECFVFDERVSVGHGLKPGPYELCRSCRYPVGDAERASPKYVLGVSCPHCHDITTDAQKQGFAERQRQVELARRRGEAHVGAHMPDKAHAVVATVD